MEMNKVYNALSLEEKKMFYDYAYSYSNHDPVCYGYDEENSRRVLSHWAKNKEWLYEAFGEKLIISKDFEYNKDETQLQNEMYDKVCEGTSFFNKFSTFIMERCRPTVPYLVYKNLFELLYSDTLVKNVFTPVTRKYGEEPILEFPNGKSINFAKCAGAKVIKLISRIAKEFDIGTAEEFEEFRLAHSMVLNQKKIKGTINLSIHPLDFATMSDNEEGWSSCMSWRECGDYRQGTVEMMNSDKVIVAYISSSRNEFRIKDSYWNSKKWRQLFIVDKDAIVGIKGYPYRNNDLTKIICGWIKDILSEKGYTYSDSICKFSNYDMLPNSEATVNFYASGHMYSDMDREHFGYFSTQLLMIPGRHSFDFSGESSCVLCGEITNNQDLYSESLTCKSCYSKAEIIRCTNCNEPIYPGDVIYDEYSRPWCGYCYDGRDI